MLLICIISYQYTNTKFAPVIVDYVIEIKQHFKSEEIIWILDIIVGKECSPKMLKNINALTPQPRGTGAGIQPRTYRVVGKNKEFRSCTLRPLFRQIKVKGATGIQERLRNHHV